jgi:hypothetical protein
VRCAFCANYIQLSESGDAAVVSSPRRERFRYADGRETGTEYYETDVWYLPDGKRRVTHIRLSTVKEYPLAK